MDTNDHGRFIGQTLYSSDNEKIGKIGQVFLDDDTDRPEFLTVNTGLFGLSESFVPAADADVTGDGVRRRVPDRVCALAVLSMTSAFTGGDLSGGIVDGLRQIADAAGKRDALTATEAKQGQLAVRGDALGAHNAPASGAGAPH